MSDLKPPSKQPSKKPDQPPHTSPHTSPHTPSSQPSSQPPRADQRPHLLIAHGDRRIDEYFWLREKENPEVMSYLQKENTYLDEVMKDQIPLQDQLFDELKSFIQEDDQSVPYVLGPYLYYWKLEKGKQYPIRYRKLFAGGPEELILDENELSDGLGYFHLGLFKISPNHRFLAYSVDQDGSEKFTLYIKDLTTGSILSESIKEAYYSLAWFTDNSGFLYNCLDQFGRPDRILFHRLGDDPINDKLIYKEEDPVFFVHTWLSRDQNMIFISSKGATTSEYYFLRSAHPPLLLAQSALKLIRKRSPGVIYTVDHHRGFFFLLINDLEKNNRLIRIPVEYDFEYSPRDEVEEWHRGDRQRFLINFFAFETFLVLHESIKGLPHFRILTNESIDGELIEFCEPTYLIKSAANPEFSTTKFRFIYSSLVTPRTVYEYDVGTKKSITVKIQSVLHYNEIDYQSERLFFTSHDGVEVPVSIVYRKDTPKDGTAPLFLTGYGAYGNSTDAEFSINYLSLLNRGFVVALAHIRGGSELGKSWYENGKFLKKKNSFFDFIACAEGLIREKFTREGRIIIMGGSAGGMLIGACINLRPELFLAAIAHVPFVDVVTTMLDPSLPLTTNEYEEWGNPEIKEYYDYLKSYSPYDNVESKDYPHLFITAGFNDPRVTYWEPAKWTARLRAMKTDNNLLLLKTNMEAGHSGASGRYDALKDAALDFAFILKVLSIDGSQKKYPQKTLRL